MTNRQMKDSGIEWIGEIPAHWKVSRFRYCFIESKEVNGASPVGEMLSISGYRGVEAKEYSTESLKRDDDQLENYRVVRKGQLAINTMWMNYAGLGVSDLEGHMSPAYRAYNFQVDMDKKYAHYLLRSSLYVDGYTALLQGVRPNSLQMSRESLMNFPILLPPLEEQRAIANYLQEILDQFVLLDTKWESMLEHLAVRRESLIWHGVQGIQTNDALRTIAEGTCFQVPSEEWSLQRLGQLANIQGGGTPTTDEANWDGAIPWATPSDMSSQIGKPLKNTARNITENGLRSGSKAVQSGSVLVSCRAPIGHICLSESLIAYNQGVKGVTPRVDLDVDFLALALQASRKFMQSLGNGTTFQEISASSLSSLRLPIPPIHLQRSIVVDLSEKLKRLDALANSLIEARNLLSHRRTTIITDAVTGRLTVRGNLNG